MAPIHPFAPPTSTKFDSLFDEGPTNPRNNLPPSGSPVSSGGIREGGNVPDFRDRTTDPNEEVIFESLFEQAGGSVSGLLTGDRAVPFFQRSGLDSNTLSKIWQMADTNGEGVLRLPGFKVAMKLIGLAQSQRPVSLAHLREACPLPEFEGIRVGPPRSLPPPEELRRGPRATTLPRTSPFETSSPFDRLTTTTPSWSHGAPLSSTISLTESQKYLRIFRKASFNQDYLDGNAVRDIMMKSGLPVDTLRDIWNLADTQGRGFLEAYEFIIAMFYVESLMNETVADVPIRLPLKVKESAILSVDTLATPYNTPLSRQASFAAPNPRSTYLGSPPDRSSLLPPSGMSPSRDPSLSLTTGDPTWAIPQAERTKYYGFFDSIVVSPTDLMSSDKAYAFFIKSQLPSSTLSRVWDLASIQNQDGLSRDEFAVAMYLIYAQLAGQPLPTTLPLDLIPPRFRMNDPFTREITEPTVPFDPFVSTITNRTHTAGANSYGSATPPTSQSRVVPANPVDLLSFDNSPSTTTNDPSPHGHSTMDPPRGLPSFAHHQLKDTIKDLQDQITQSISAINAHRPRRAELQATSATLQAQRAQLEVRYQQELQRQSEVMEETASLQNQLQLLRPDHGTRQNLYLQQQERFTQVQEEQQRRERQIAQDLLRSQQAKEYVQVAPQRMAELEQRLASQPPLVSSDQPLPTDDGAPPTDATEPAQPATASDPFAALIETRSQPQSDQPDHPPSDDLPSKEPAAFDPFSDPTEILADSSSMKLPESAVDRTKKKDLTFGSFDDLVAHRSEQVTEVKPRFASFDDIAIRNTATPTQSDRGSVTSVEPTSAAHPQLSSSSKDPAASDSLPSATPDQSESAPGPTSVPEPEGTPSETTQPDPSQNDPFLALVQSEEATPRESTPLPTTPHQSVGSPSHSVLFSAFEDSTKAPEKTPEPSSEKTTTAPKISTRENLVNFFSADTTKWTETNLISGGPAPHAPQLNYELPTDLFHPLTTEFPPPRPLPRRGNSSSNIQSPSLHHDPFASIAQRTDPFDLPDATLTQMARRVSGTGSLRFEDAFGDDFLPSPPTTTTVKADPPAKEEVAATDGEVAVDPTQIPLPTSTTTHPVEATTDPTTTATDPDTPQIPSSSHTTSELATLLSMGFDPQAATLALAKFGNDPDAATHHLLDATTTTPPTDTVSPDPANPDTDPTTDPSS